MNQLQPRQYQIEAVSSLYKYFGENDGHPLIALPTGTGKSVVIAMFLQSIFWQYQNQRVMVLTHVKELVSQNYQKLKTIWPGSRAGIYSAGLNKRDVAHPIIFAGIGSVANKAHLFGHVDIVIIDEAHLVSSKETTSYRKFIFALMQKNHSLKIIGLTATPWRSGIGQLTDGGLFTDVCYDLTSMANFNQLIDQGYLAHLTPKHTQVELDTAGIKVQGGDFVASELQLACNRDDVTLKALTETLRLAADRCHVLVFATGVEHCIRISEMLNEMGCDSVAIYSGMGNPQRDAAILDFKRGKYRFAVNNNVLTTGFDFPEIDCIVMLRPTMSTVLWVQMLGRGTRPCEGKKNCLVLDYARNTLRLGPINDPVLPKRKGKGKGQAPVKVCPKCMEYNHASARVCSGCGEEFLMDVKFGTEAGLKEIIKREEEPAIIEDFTVTRITYSAHHKQDKPVSLKVTYFCGLAHFTSFVCLEHSGYIQRKAILWWIEHSEGKTETPKTIKQALELTTFLKQPTTIRVQMNEKFPEIIARFFEPSDSEIPF